MGRAAAPEPLSVDVVREQIGIRADGVLVRRVAHMNAFKGQPATFQGMCALHHDGRVRRLKAEKVAWCVQTGAWPPRGFRVVVKGGLSPDDLSLPNLVLERMFAHRHGLGSGHGALEKRERADRAMLVALADIPSPSVQALADRTGISRARASERLTRLEGRGLTEGPKCCPGRSWLITDAGRAVAAAGGLVLDDLDADILRTLASPMGGAKLSRRLGTCEATVKRRTTLLVRRGLLYRDPRGFFEVTAEGRKAIGPPAVPVSPWLETTKISAAMSREVVERGPTIDDRTRKQVSAHQPGRLTLLNGGKRAHGRPPGGKWSGAALREKRATPAE